MDNEYATGKDGQLKDFYGENEENEVFRRQIRKKKIQWANKLIKQKEEIEDMSTLNALKLVGLVFIIIIIDLTIIIISK